MPDTHNWTLLSRFNFHHLTLERVTITLLLIFTLKCRKLHGEGLPFATRLSGLPDHQRHS